MKEVISREVRVFLSSTFRDMDPERNILMTKVFPELRALCQERGVSFSEIDLRWGITEEDSHNGRTIEICLDEIERSRQYPPFFIGFLGERYGWIPTHEDLSHYWESRNDSLWTDKIRLGLDQGISVTEMEMKEGVLDYPEATTHARVFLRAAPLTDELCQEKIGKTPSPRQEKDWYDPANGKLETLKQTLRQRGQVGIDGYATLEEFAEGVRKFLVDAIDTLYPPSSAPTPMERRNRSHALYAAYRLKGYVPLPELRKQSIESVKTSLTDWSGQHVLIHGASGLGKSAFLANLETELEKDFWVHAHYTGADGELSLEGWRDRLLDALKKEGDFFSPLPESSDTLWEELPRLLSEAQGRVRRPMVLLLDALNQVTPAEAASRLKSLILPPQVALVVSSTDIPDPSWFTIEMPSLDAPHKAQVISVYLETFRKKLSRNLIETLVNDDACSVPLFLRLVLEELRMHARYETLRDLLKDLLTTRESGALFRYVLEQMDKDYARVPATQTARFLAAAFRGISYRDLKGVLATSTDQVDLESGSPRLADALISPLLSRLEPFLLRDAGRLSLMHNSLKRPVLEDRESLDTRRKLVDYFKDKDGDSIAQRAYQLWKLEDTSALIETITPVPDLLSFWRTEPLLLQEILGDLEAGASSPQEEIRTLGELWKKDIESANDLPPNVDQFGSWLQDSAFLWLLEPWLKAILFWRTEHDAPQEEIAKSLNNLGMLYHAQTRFTEAEPLLKQALEIRQKVLPPGHPVIAISLHNIGGIYYSQRRFTEAEPLFKQAIEIFLALPHEPTMALAASLNQLGALYQEQGRLKKSESLHQQSLEIRQKALPPGHPDIAISLNYLGANYLAQRRLKKAEPLLKEALVIRQKVLPPGHPDIATSLYNLGVLYQKQGRRAEARPLHEQALKIRQEALLPGHPDVFRSLESLSALCQYL